MNISNKQQELDQKIKELCPIFHYEKPVFPDDCEYEVSPSMIGTFFSDPSTWYKEQYLNQERSFKGNTSTVTGTICHHIYEQVTLGNIVTREEINRQLSIYHTLVQNPDVDINQVMVDYPLVSEVVVNQYLLKENKHNKPIVEKKVVGRIKGNIYIGGTLDRYCGSTIIDFKTVKNKPNENYIPFDYKIQLLSYAYALRQQGYYVDTIQIVYGIKPTKTLPARCLVVSEPIDYIAEKLLSDSLQLIADSILTVKENPRLAYLIFKSMEFKE